MPVYEYACTECGEQLQVRQSFTDAALTECPVCSGRLRKVLSPVGVVFKGSGFYRTDSRAGANGSSASTNDGPPKDGAAKGSDSKDGKKTDTAAAASASNGSSGSSSAKAAASTSS